eukprot:751960-Hanusia_phi.AAC.7
MMRTIYGDMSCDLRVCSRKILHRDIKSANVFLHRSDERGNAVVKLGDFGISKVLEATQGLAKTAVGTPYYMSPELCSGKCYGYKSDMWALGIVLYEMASLRPAFDAHSFNALVVKILKGKFSPISSVYSPDLHDAVQALLDKDTALRPDVNQFLQLPFIRRRLVFSNISHEILENEFAHTALHGFDAINAVYSNKKNPRPSSSSPASASDFL